ncbi:cation acetate symporter [Leucobacter weissii]|uniref:Cation acetate symporter n=1 Tax=Leucobacter weissii TaxID=1983706 RepID=A0A939SAX2_9MICO|nr:cation acetate symporter [Leucobacter weissii]MBO1902397.1 cation acetate symporter [Leucobacter weissii]
MNPVFDLIAVGLLVVATAVMGFAGVRVSRTTGDFFVASRSVRPVWNASAISGEYLSAGTFLGLAGLVLLSGSEGFWFPIGYAAGYLLVLLFVAAPLRRSGAYTIPDFVQARLRSLAARRITSIVVLVIGWLYIVPQMHGAALSLGVVAGMPRWAGAVVIAVLVAAIVAAGGMRAITAVQAMQYWIKLTALALPAIVMLIVLFGADTRIDPAEAFPVEAGPAGTDAYATLSLLFALLLGTIGLPHVLVRFYTSPNGASARHTTVLVIVMIGLFYAASSTMGLIARVVAPEMAEAGLADTVVLALPTKVLPGLAGQLLTALIVAGAFAAFLGTASGLVVSLAGVVSQELFGGTVRGFRISAVLCTLVPLVWSLITIGEGLVSSVGTVFVFAASSLTPVILLGVWWSRLTARGAIAGMLVGAASCGGALIAFRIVGPDHGLWSSLLAQPGAWTIPLSALAVVVVSLLDRRRRPPSEGFLSRLQRPDPAPRGMGGRD